MSRNARKNAQRILVTGAASGLGRFLAEKLATHSLTRATPSKRFEAFRKTEWDAIIHCAFNNKRPLFDADLYGYYRDNIELTRELVSFPCSKFVYLSSVDVYPPGEYSGEDVLIPLDRVKGIYALTKLINEVIIAKERANHLVLRASALIGRHSRENSLIKIVRAKAGKLTLSADSTFNYVLHRDVLQFIRVALKQNLRGVYNIASSENISLGEIAKMLGRKVKFGAHRYRTNKIPNAKAAKVCEALKCTSLQNVGRFMIEEGCA